MLPNDQLFIFVLLFGIVTAAVHFIFAVAVFSDSQSIAERTGRETFLLSGIVWAVAVLVGGVLVVGLYWLIHYSTLAGNNRRD